MSSSAPVDHTHSSSGVSYASKDRPAPKFETQLELLSDSPIARRNDPSTSHEAAEHITNSGKRASQQNAVLDLVKRFPGHTSAELAAKSSLDRWTVARRLPELRAAYRVSNGAKRDCSVTGLKALVWYPT